MESGLHNATMSATQAMSRALRTYDGVLRFRPCMTGEFIGKSSRGSKPGFKRSGSSADAGRARLFETGLGSVGVRAKGGAGACRGPPRAGRGRLEVGTILGRGS